MGRYALGVISVLVLLASVTTRLTITVWPQGDSVAHVRRYTLSCGPAAGTVPRPATACGALRRLGAGAFAPTPSTAACASIWGGPAQARVRGVVGGRAVAARFSLADGCEIARWNKLRAVVPQPAS